MLIPALIARVTGNAQGRSRDRRSAKPAERRPGDRDWLWPAVFLVFWICGPLVIWALAVLT
jgi:hypothetical protein